MRQRHASRGARRDREFEVFVAGAGGRLLHTATLLTAEPPDDNPRARHLLALALAHTYACWDRMRGEDPYDLARRYLAVRFARGAWHHRLPHPGRARPAGVLARLSPQERLIVVLRLYEGVAEEQTAALLGTSPDRVRAVCHRAVTTLLRPPRGPAPAAAPVAKAVPS
ncbi:sigma factor-like helix-turn-helix DNA-binding protein [Streptomyces sp. NPDC052682]|uniref:sigma factor-like helix-turn-helix DNA-binding protein n=1 Tax=Streptomyces sp. NPDC052682 TaxID=3154954 RepID=UPI003416D0C0